jgi:hypothetical protein
MNAAANRTISSAVRSKPHRSRDEMGTDDIDADEHERLGEATVRRVRKTLLDLVNRPVGTRRATAGRVGPDPSDVDTPGGSTSR